MLAGGADAKQLNLVGGDLVAGGFGDFGGQLVEQADVRIDDTIALGADQVRMGVGFVAVVTVAAVGKANFQDFADFFEQVDGFVNRGQTGRREMGFDLIVDLLHTWMLVGIEKSLEDGNPLRRYPAFPLPKFAENVIQAFLRIFHVVTLAT